MRESVAVLRELLEGKRVDFEGETMKIKGKLNFKPGEIKIYVGAQGPKMLKLAGEIADGVLINASHPEDIEFAIEQVNNPKIDIGAYASVSVSEDGEKAIGSATPVVAFIASGTSDEILRRHDIDVAKAREIGRRLAKGDFKGAFGLVDDYMIEAFCIAGTPGEVKEKIATLREKGITQMVCGSPLGPDKGEAIRMLAEMKKGFKKGNEKKPRPE
jgi:5,10-methylenetetrahydromethanopterin reductase